MDTSAITFRRIRSKQSALLWSVVVLSFCLTGCDILRPAGSTATNQPAKPATDAEQHDADHHSVAVTPLPERSPKPAEPIPAPAPSPRINEPKPSPGATPPKGGERLVALSSATQPHASESAAPPAKPTVTPAPKTEAPVATAASSEVPQALFFKGPPREPAPPGHKLLWLGLGLGLCAAAGGGILWVRFYRRRQPQGIVPNNREEICLPKELTLRECTIPAEEPALAEPEPVPMAKKPVVAEKKPVLVEKEPGLVLKEPVLSEKT